MATDVTKEFLQNHFRKHDSVTLYKKDGTPITFRKQYDIVLRGGYTYIAFKDFDAFADFYNKQHLCLTPVINIS